MTEPDDKAPPPAAERHATRFDVLMRAAIDGAVARRSEGPPAEDQARGLRIPVPSPASLQRAAAFEREQQVQQHALARRHLADRKKRAEELLPGSFRWASFDAPELGRRVRRLLAIEEARRAITEARVVLVGGAGTGKTSLAAAMFRHAFVTSGGQCLFEMAHRLSVARRNYPLGQGEPELVTRALACDLLVLDDVGSEKPVPSTAVDDVVAERHWHGRPTWVTTGRTIEEIAERYGDGIARRVFENAVHIDCDGGIGR